MAIRIRLVDGKMKALCANETQGDYNDLYLNDNSKGIKEKP